ncbi:MAG: glycosyltransferase [Bacilli bacterium]|nr:glycosyltransferase [Bacilli bacterium]
MSTYKICVYAISKNEEKFVKRWVESMNEADAIYVLDTGSTDQTVKKLKKYGVHVTKKEIKPWRFDVARNESLKLVPEDYDICVCTDLDEVFKPGWRKKLEELWKEDTTRARYNYNWSLDENDQPIVNFYIEKMHKRKGYQWTHPVHEVLEYSEGAERVITTDEITLNHYPDHSKSRGSYLPLLELSVEESPEDDRNMHYLGREYMYYGRWNECIDTLIRHLNLKTAIWPDERAASMRFIARSYRELKRYEEARMWLDKAMIEAPHLRDPFVERVILEYHLQNYPGVIQYGLQALEIKQHPKTYINEVFSWNNTIYDLLSLAYYYTGNPKEALRYIDFALAMDPDDERLQNNKKLIEKEVS